MIGIRLFQHEWRYLNKTKSDVVLPVIFFILILVLCHFILASELQHSLSLGLGLIWIALSLTCLMTSDRLWSRDLQHASVVPMMYAKVPFYALILSKWLAFLCYFMLVLGVFFPLLVLAYHIPRELWGVLGLSLTMSLGCFLWMGLWSSSLLAHIPQASLLVCLVAVPVYFPVLIFGILACQYQLWHQDPSGPLLALSALLLVWLLIATTSIGPLLKHRLND